ncbi:hypothetical protein [Aporhodopirellula aestuarii]|uniref:Uncharacterized protein n=1 Tax=Aporhodopirellula aestuarii TaxID=2950107 RepID=A0ABT0U5Y5_9BACT|nr:hypothetical protein [Aporhodopirellula aestuarii]MCM2372329.1 hypothetical protein [Aporhodopirellula aestuarii]
MKRMFQGSCYSVLAALIGLVAAQSVGGLYGACFGLPVAFIWGPIGLVENRMTSGRTNDQ